MTATVETKFVSKLAVKNAGISPKLVINLKEGETFLKLCTIVGIATGIKQVEDLTTGKLHFPFIGQFQGINPVTGAKTNSGILYLPTGIHETYESAVRKLEEGESARFALEIRAVVATNPQGYSYEAIDLLPTTTIDPLANILALATGKTSHAALPAASETKVAETKAAEPVQQKPAGNGNTAAKK